MIECEKMMLPYFHTSGRKVPNYFIKIWEILQWIPLNIITLHKKVTPRRTNKFFAGIQSRQTIEQTLNDIIDGCPFKRGVTDSIVYEWIKGIISTKNILEDIENYYNIFQYERIR